VLAGEAFEAGIHFLGILFGELGDGMDAEPIEIAEHRWADRDEVAELALGSHGLSFLFALLSPKAKADFTASLVVRSRGNYESGQVADEKEGGECRGEETYSRAFCEGD
jgi:hypothetical protein